MVTCYSYFIRWEYVEKIYVYSFKEIYYVLKAGFLQEKQRFYGYLSLLNIEVLIKNRKYINVFIRMHWKHMWSYGYIIFHYFYTTRSFIASFASFSPAAFTQRWKKMNISFDNTRLMSNSENGVEIEFDLVSLSGIKARPKSFNIATAQTDDCAVLINPYALNGPFIRNGNKKSLALSQLLAIILVLPIDGARNLARFYYYAHPHMYPLHPFLSQRQEYNAEFRSRRRAIYTYVSDR